MTSRERLLATIAHRTPDRVPLDLGATPSSGISAIAYSHLKGRIGMPELPTLVYDVVQQLAQPDVRVLDHFGVDVVDIGRAFNTEPSAWRDVQLVDGSPAKYPAWFHPRAEPDGAFTALLPDGTAIARMPESGTFFDQTCFPYLDGYPSDFSQLGDAMGKILWSALVHSPWDHAADPDFWAQLRARTLALRAGTDRALMVVVGCNLFEWGTFLRRIDNFLADLLEDEVAVARLLDALMEKHLAFLGKVCEAVGDIVDVCRFGDDLGMDSGPFMRPQIYRDLFKPRHAQLCAFVKKHSRMHTFLHSCGSIYQLIPDLIDAGFDILNPVQTNSRFMDPATLKKEFGRDVTFWGAGCDTRAILNRATPAEVRAHVLERLGIFAPGGGFVFNTVHNILPEVPPENILAMYGALREFNGE
jgi:uroporphyrinogen decarboxylase